MAYELGYAQHGDTETARAAVVGAFEDWLRGNRSMWQSELAGKNLACYCPAGAPCHADVLLRLANPTEG
jgi:hypothetical protein